MKICLIWSQAAQANENSFGSIHVVLAGRGLERDHPDDGLRQLLHHGLHPRSQVRSPPQLHEIKVSN